MHGDEQILIVPSPLRTISGDDQRLVVSSPPSSRPQVPPKPNVPDRQSKAERNLVLSNQYSALSDDEMDLSSVL